MRLSAVPCIALSAVIYARQSGRQQPAKGPNAKGPKNPPPWRRHARREA